MRGKIEAVKESQSGKSLSVKIGERYFTTKNWDMREHVNKMIEFDPSTTEWNGKTIYWINDYALVNNTPVETPKTSAGVAGVPRMDSTTFLPFTSNVVANAIQAGAITSPDDIPAWAHKAFVTIKSLAEGTFGGGSAKSSEDDFDDDIPF